MYTYIIYILDIDKYLSQKWLQILLAQINSLSLIQSRPLNCNSEKVLYLLRWKICDDTSYVGKAKIKFRLWFNNYKSKSKHQFFRKRKQNVPQNLFHSHLIQDCHRGIDDWWVTLFEKCETHKQLKEREIFWQHKLKTSYPFNLNEKEEYLF